MPTTARTDDEGFWAFTEDCCPEGLLALQWPDSFGRPDEIMTRLELVEREAAVRLPTETSATIAEMVSWMDAA